MKVSNSLDPKMSGLNWVSMGKVQNFTHPELRKSEFKTCCMPPNYHKIQVVVWPMLFSLIFADV